MPLPDSEIRDAAVELSALVNPIDEFGPIFEAALANAQAAGELIADDPAPILTQILANQIGNIAGIGSGIEAQVNAITDLPELLAQAVANELGNVSDLAGLGQAFVENFTGLFTSGTLENQFQTALDGLASGDYSGAFGALFGAGLLLVAGQGLGNLSLLPELVPVLQQPLADLETIFPIASGPLENAQAAIGVFQNPANFLLLGLGAIAPLATTATAAGDTLEGLVEAAQTGDPELAFNTIVTQAATVTKALLDGAVDPTLGVLPNLQKLREAIAEAITPTAEESVSEVAKTTSSAVQSFTLTTPLETTPEPKSLTTSGGEKTESDAAQSNAGSSDTDETNASTKDSTVTATTTEATDATKSGNLFTPGTISTKGGRHRAETGSFGQGLRDAAKKTIKSLTGLGRDKKSGSSSETSSSESGSNSSGSGDSGSGGDSGSD
ncbi:hypothetical protein DVS77_13350 [Mycolicibacterium moriokaense]|nr:hypothetical protein DVS77_13350 [Mycolicibacterium moriokaense]